MATRKVSVTIDEDLLQEAKARAGSRGLSAYLNELLVLQLQQERLREYLIEMEEEHGPIPDEILEEVRAEWRSAERVLPRQKQRRSA